MYTYYKVGNTSQLTNKSSSNSVRQSHHDDHDNLQREVDSYTCKLEQEKRKYFSIQYTHKNVRDFSMQTMKELKQQQYKLNELKKVSSSSYTLQLAIRIKHLESSLEQAINSYDSGLAYNSKLKAEINVLRKYKRSIKQITNTLQDRLKCLSFYLSNYSKIVNYRYKLQIFRKQNNYNVKNQILEIQQQNQTDKQLHEYRIYELKTTYEQSRLLRDSKVGDLSQKTYTVDTQTLMKARLKKIIAKNSDKVKFIEQYQRNFKAIEEGFEKIKAISGLTELYEIANTFIKGYYQNSALHSYIIDLSQTIEHLTENNKLKRQQINSLKNQKYAINKQLECPTQQEIHEIALINLISQKEYVIQRVSYTIENSQEKILQITDLLTEQGIVVYTNLSYEDIAPEQILNINNVYHYLSKIDRYINGLFEKSANARKTKSTLYFRKEEVKVSQLPFIDDREDREPFLYTLKDFKKYAEEYIDKKKKTKY